MAYNIEFLDAKDQSHAESLGFAFDFNIPVSVDIARYPSYKIDAYRLEFGDWWYYYLKDGSLYVQHPSKKIIGNLVYTFTYIFGPDAVPVIREDNKTIENVVIEHWMAGIFGNRLKSLQRFILRTSGSTCFMVCRWFLIIIQKHLERLPTNY